MTRKNARPPHYFGVTGFTTPEEVDNVLDSYTAPLLGGPHLSGRRLMVGVLASWKTLNGKAPPQPYRYPKIDRIAQIFAAAAKKTRHANPLEEWPDRNLGTQFDLSTRTIRLIHYNSHAPDLHRQLDRLSEIAGPHLDGFQLNIAWPSRNELGLWKVDREKMRLVLQVNRFMFDDVGRDPEALCERLKQYEGLMTDILFDLSGGEGLPIDLPKAEIAIKTLYKHFGKRCGIGIAGALNHSSVVSLQPLFKRYPRLSCDAESKIRDLYYKMQMKVTVEDQKLVPVLEEGKKVVIADTLGEMARYYLRNAFGITIRSRKKANP